MHIAKNIIYLRDKHRLSQPELADKIGKTPSTISKYEKGKAEPPATILLKFEEIFNIDVSDLIHLDLTDPANHPYRKRRRTTGTKAVMKRTAKQYAEAIEYDEMTAEEVAREIGNENMKLVNRLLMQRVLELEQAIKDADPEMAKRLKIE